MGRARTACAALMVTALLAAGCGGADETPGPAARVTGEAATPEATADVAGGAEGTTAAADGGGTATGTSDDATIAADDEAAQTTPTVPDVDYPPAPERDPSAPSVSLTFTGDVMLGERIGSRVLSEGPASTFAGTKEMLLASDLTVVNVENAIGGPEDMAEPQPKGYTFMAPPEVTGALVDADIDLITLANNHVYDYGAPGIQSTLEAVDAAGIPHVGLGLDEASARKPVILEVDGVTFAFLGYTEVGYEMRADGGTFYNEDWAAKGSEPGVAWAYPENIGADVSAARQKADHVIVLLHSGPEQVTEHGDTKPVQVRAAIDAGATAVIGHHPHILQGYDWDQEKGTYVAWSLGNFVFYPFANPVANESAALHLEVAPSGVVDARWTPVVVDGDGRTWVLDRASAQAVSILDRIERLSQG